MAGIVAVRRGGYPGGEAGDVWSASTRQWRQVWPGRIRQGIDISVSWVRQGVRISISRVCKGVKGCIVRVLKKGPLFPLVKSQLVSWKYYKILPNFQNFKASAPTTYAPLPSIPFLGVWALCVSCFQLLCLFLSTNPTREFGAHGLSSYVTLLKVYVGTSNSTNKFGRWIGSKICLIWSTIGNHKDCHFGLSNWS